MDKYTNSIWFSRVVALALAALLFVSVNFESKGDKNSLFNTPGEVAKETIKDVPVEIAYDHDNLVVTGAPETVDVTLEGVKSLLIPTMSQRDFQVYIDLSDPEITLGEKKVPLKIRNLNEKMSAAIEPAYATVTVQERVTKEFTVEVEYNRSLIEDGYTAEAPVVSPQSVKITGAKSEIDRISFVKATLGLTKGVTDSVNKEAVVRALDRDLNKLNVDIEPGTVDVSMKVNIPSKMVPVRPVQEGTPKTGYSIESIKAVDKEVTIYGKESVLNSISQVTVPVDVSNVTKNAEYELPITIPDGVKKISQEKAAVKINVKKEETSDQEKADEEEADPASGQPEEENDKDEEPSQEDQTEDIQSKTFSSLSIDPAGLDEDKDLRFISPAGGKVDITLKGTSQELKNIKASDIQLSINAAKLGEGTHSAAIQVKVPDGIKWELAERTATITITNRAEDTP